jgi:hypothetical protein
VILELKWDTKRRRYVTKEQLMAEERKGKSLQDVGTRYRHLTDLRDLWAEGIDALSSIKPAYKTESDTNLLKSLTTAVAMLDKQIEVLSDYNTGAGFYMGRDIDKAISDVKSGKLEGQ